MGRRQDRACTGLEDLRREVNRALSLPLWAGGMPPTGRNPFATPRQHCRARIDLRIDRVRLCDDLPGEPRAQSRPWRVDDARRVYAAGDRVAVLRACGDGARRRCRPKSGGRTARLRLPHAQDDRRDGAGGNSHHGRARHSDPRAGRAALVGATAIPGPGAWRDKSLARDR